MHTMIDKIYGGIRYERVDHSMPVVLNSGVSLAEAVKVWMESVKECGRLAELDRRLDAWQGRKRGH